LKKKILVVIKDELLRRAIERALTANTKDEITAVGVAGRTEAIAVMDAEPKSFDLVVTEPGQTSTFSFFTSTIRQTNPSARIVLYADDESTNLLRRYAEATVLKLENDATIVLRQTVLLLLAS
jgi:DNA-binding NarL/FixJ family response regulator